MGVTNETQPDDIVDGPQLLESVARLIDTMAGTWRTHRQRSPMALLVVILNAAWRLRDRKERTEGTGGCW
jgi:hypothetical protein